MLRQGNRNGLIVLAADLGGILDINGRLALTGDPFATIPPQLGSSRDDFRSYDCFANLQLSAAKLAQKLGINTFQYFNLRDDLAVIAGIPKLTYRNSCQKWTCKQRGSIAAGTLPQSLEISAQLVETGLSPVVLHCVSPGGW